MVSINNDNQLMTKFQVFIFYFLINTFIWNFFETFFVTNSSQVKYFLKILVKNYFNLNLNISHPFTCFKHFLSKSLSFANIWRRYFKTYEAFPNISSYLTS